MNSVMYMCKNFPGYFPRNGKHIFITSFSKMIIGMQFFNLLPSLKYPGHLFLSVDIDLHYAFLCGLCLYLTRPQSPLLKLLFFIIT